MKFRKKPIEVEAFQVNPDIHRCILVTKRIEGGIGYDDFPRWMKEAWGNVLSVHSHYSKEFGHHIYDLKIKTPEGYLSVRANDWIIKGIKGELYPVSDEVFKLTYENTVEENKDDLVFSFEKSMLKKCHGNSYTVELKCGACSKRLATIEQMELMDKKSR